MDNLPPSLLLDILSRLTDTNDVIRCRLTNKTLNSLSYQLSSVYIYCTYDRYTKSRSNPSIITPFKTVVTRFVTPMSQLDSVSLGVDNSLSGLCFDDVEDENDDLHLTDVGFVSDWLMIVKANLKKVSIVDFWVQACWRRSKFVSLISENCHRLNELEVKNAWLSMDEVIPMSSLTSLTLEYIRLDDENLTKFNECFPCLQTLNLIGVGGLLNPQICLKHLKTCEWTISNAPLSLTIFAPSMVRLKLKCVKPRSLVLETPLLLDLHLTLEFANLLVIKELPHLQKLWIESHSLRDLIYSFPCSMSVKELSLNSTIWGKLVKAENPSFELIFDVFPILSSLRVGPTVYSELETSFGVGRLCTVKGLKLLKDFTAHLVVNDVEVTLSFISFIIGTCDNLSTISLLIHRDFDPGNASSLISQCTSLCSRVQWKWGFWKEGTNDVWVSDIA